MQFDLPGASIDNVRVWKASGQRADWIEARKKLAMAQATFRCSVDFIWGFAARGGEPTGCVDIRSRLLAGN